MIPPPCGLDRNRLCCRCSVVIIGTHKISKIPNLESVLWRLLIAFGIRSFVSMDGSLDHTTHVCVPLIVCVERQKVKR